MDIGAAARRPRRSTAARSRKGEGARHRVGLRRRSTSPPFSAGLAGRRRSMESRKGKRVMVRVWGSAGDRRFLVRRNGRTAVGLESNGERHLGGSRAGFVAQEGEGGTAATGCFGGPAIGCRAPGPGRALSGANGPQAHRSAAGLKIRHEQ